MPHPAPAWVIAVGDQVRELLNLPGSLERFRSMTRTAVDQVMRLYEMSQTTQDIFLRFCLPRQHTSPPVAYAILSGVHDGLEFPDPKVDPWQDEIVQSRESVFYRSHVCRMLHDRRTGSPVIDVRKLDWLLARGVQSNIDRMVGFVKRDLNRLGIRKGDPAQSGIPRVSPSPPDKSDVWDFPLGGFSFRGVRGTLKGKPRILLKAFAQSPQGLAMGNVLKDLWPGEEACVSDDAVRKHVGAVRAALRKAFRLSKQSDPLPAVDVLQERGWRLDTSLLTPKAVWKVRSKSRRMKR